MRSARIDPRLRRLADLGTRLIGLDGASAATIAAELAAIEALDTDAACWEEFAPAAEAVRQRLLVRGQALLRAAQGRARTAGPPSSTTTSRRAP